MLPQDKKQFIDFDKVTLQSSENIGTDRLLLSKAISDQQKIMNHNH